MIEISRAYSYAKWCTGLKNGYVGVYVKKQAEQWLEIADGKSETAYICEKTAKKITKLLKLMIHPDLGKPLFDTLEDYAMLFIYAIFCTRRKDDNTRYYQTGVLEIARKNYKTFVSAVIFIISFLIEPKFSRFFSVAPDLSLSSELLKAIKKIIKSSPALSDGKIFKIMRKEIRCLLNDSEYTPLAYSKDRLDGKLVNVFLADECSAMDNYPLAAMRSSQITLTNKLGIVISTQYPNDDNAFIDELDIAKQTLDGILDDTRYFSLLFEPDDVYKTGDSWKSNDLMIFQANPVAYSNKLVFDDLVKKRRLAVLFPNLRENFLCKHLNIKYKGLGTSCYVDITRVRECIYNESEDFWYGKHVYFGLDLSQSDDNTSLAMVTLHDGNVYAKIWGFLPHDRIKEKSEREHVDYDLLISEGCCFDCGDDIIDYGYVEEFILSIAERYGVVPVMLGYDRYNAISTIQKLERAENPIECVEIRQHSSLLHRPTKLLKEYILSHKFFYFPNRMLEINFENSQCTQDTNLNLYVNKKKSSGKVDMVVSLINALYLLQVEELDNAPSDFGCQLI